MTAANESPNGDTAATREEPQSLDIVSWINQRWRRAVAGGDTGVLIEAGAVGLITGSSVVLFNSTIHEVRVTRVSLQC